MVDVHLYIVSFGLLAVVLANMCLPLFLLSNNQRIEECAKRDKHGPAAVKILVNDDLMMMVVLWDLKC